MSEGERVLGRNLAASTGLPANYLSKILLRLRTAGIVEASRGSHGGYRMLRDAEEVTLLEVVELLDGIQDYTECLLCPGQACSAEDACAAHREWAHLREGYVGFLAGTSIGALSKRSRESVAPTADSESGALAS